MEVERQESAVALPAAAGVDVARIEKELTALWAVATRGKDDGRAGGAGVMRACVLNLIVYAPAAEGRPAIDALLDEVYERNPCRSVVLFADVGAAEEKLAAYVSTRCSRSSKGARQVCGEQVTIEASGAALGRAATAVAPLLVPDLPVFLWWKDIPHYEDRLFEGLVEISDRIVIDSASFDHPHEDLARLDEVVRRDPEYFSVSDLNWGRMTMWRSLVAGFWDVGENLPHLTALERVEIVHGPSKNGAGTLPPSALLLAGWLASGLGWEIDPTGTRAGGEVNTFTLRAAGGRGVRLEFRQGEAEAGKFGGLRSVSFTSSPGGAEFVVEAKGGGSKLETATRLGGGERAVGRVLDCQAQSEGQMLGNELGILTRDKVYEKAVAACARLLESLSR